MKIQENVSLAPFTTFRIGGAARFFVRVQSVADIEEAVSFAKHGDKQENTSQNSFPVFILGGGSNVLVSDAGWSGLAIKMELKGITEEIEGDFVRIIAGAGEDWDSFVKYTVEEEGLYGLENLSFIPGTVGASPVQNIGAYGTEAKDVIEWVEVFDPATLQIKKLTNAECQFGYRDSLFKHAGKNFIVTRVAFKLSRNGKVNTSYKDLQKYFSENNAAPSLSLVREQVIVIRTKKLPDVRQMGTAGSFFKNPTISNEHYQKLLEKYQGLPSFPVDEKQVKVSTAWILDNICGFKGLRRGEVGVYKNQALVLVNFGKGTAEEIKTLANEIIASVKEKTGIVIYPEVEFVG